MCLFLFICGKPITRLRSMRRFFVLAYQMLPINLSFFCFYPFFCFLFLLRSMRKCFFWPIKLLPIAVCVFVSVHLWQTYHSVALNEETFLFLPIKCYLSTYHCFFLSLSFAPSLPPPFPLLSLSLTLTHTHTRAHQWGSKSSGWT